MTKVKIIANPYDRTIKYQTYEDGEWQDITSDSNAFSNSDFTTNKLLSQVAKNVIEKIIEIYGKESELVFEGVKDDFDDLKNVVDIYYKEQVSLQEKKEFELRNPDEIFPKILNIFRNSEGAIKDIKEHHLSFDTSNIQKELSKIKEVSQAVSVCVMGLYSVGKSAFINALVGMEILPSETEPTTAKIFKIRQIKDGKEPAIRFDYMNKSVSITFKDDTPVFDGIDKSSEFFRKVTDAFNASDSFEKKIHNVVEIINGEDKDIGQLVEVEIPFSGKGPLNNCEYVFEIYDMPGPDSAKYENHLEIFKNALDRQINSLPILVTVPDQLDSKANEEIKELIHSNKAFDETYIMVVVNKSDEKASNTLDKLKNNCLNMVAANWDSNRVYFVSSIMGLASKLKPNESGGIDFASTGVNALYDEKIASFTNPDNKIKRELYKYNIVSKERFDDILKKSSEYNPLFLNSGLCFVENEISYFAKRDSSYDRCRKAKTYFSNAIGMAKTAIDGEKVKRENERKKIDDDFEKLLKEINRDLEEINNSIENSKNAYRSEVKKYVAGIDKQIDIKDIKNIVKEIKSEKNADWQDVVVNKVYEKAQTKLLECEDKLLEKTKQRFREEEGRFKIDTIKAVVREDSLIENECKRLERLVKDFGKSVAFTEIDKKEFDYNNFKKQLLPILKKNSDKWWHTIVNKIVDFCTILNKKALKNKYDKLFSDKIEEFCENMLTAYVQDFSNWYMDLRNELKIEEVNPACNKKLVELEKYDEEIEWLEKMEIYLSEKNEELEKLMK